MRANVEPGDSGVRLRPSETVALLPSALVGHDPAYKRWVTEERRVGNASRNRLPVHPPAGHECPAYTTAS